MIGTYAKQSPSKSTSSDDVLRFLARFPHNHQNGHDQTIFPTTNEKDLYEIFRSSYPI